LVREEVEMALPVDTAVMAMNSHVEAMEKRLAYGGTELDRLTYEVEAARIWIEERPVLDVRLVHLRNCF
jgi:hypothetical protein